MRRGALLVVVVLGSVLGVSLSSGSAWAAANWAVHVAAVSSGEAHAQALPTAPTATSACGTTARTVKVSWAAITHATAYAVYESTTTVGGTYNLVVSGVTTTSWTTGVLTAGNYWFEVAAGIGTNWASSKSAATAQRTVTSTACS